MDDALREFQRGLHQLAEREGYLVLKNYDYLGGDFLALSSDDGWLPEGEYARFFDGGDVSLQTAWRYAYDAVAPLRTRYTNIPLSDSGGEYESLLLGLPRAGDDVDLGALIVIRNGIRERIRELDAVLNGAQRVVKQALIIAIEEAKAEAVRDSERVEALVERLWRSVGLRGSLRDVEDVWALNLWPGVVQKATENAMRHLGERIEPLVAGLKRLDRRRYFHDIVINSLLIGREPPRWDEVQELVRSTGGFLHQTELEQQQRRLLAIPSRMAYIAELRSADYTWGQAYDKLDKDWGDVFSSKAFPYSGPESMRKSFEGHMKNR